MAMTRIEIALFGPVEMRLGDRVLRPKARKDGALVARLGFSPGEVHSRSYLAGLLWGDSGERQARDSLKQSLLRLRRLLDGFVADALLTDRHSASLCADKVSVDVVRFLDVIGAGSLDAMESALELRRGIFLEGLDVDALEFEQWRAKEQAGLERSYRDAALGLMRRGDGATNLERTAKAARCVLASDPLHEEACRTLMHVHAQRGEQREALGLFHDLRDRVHVELGIEPEASTLQLAEDIRARRAPGTPPALTSAYPVDPDIRETSRLASGSSKTAEDPPSIAVLPFVNIGPDLSHDYFADGLSEDIITDLARLGRVNVLSRNVSFSLRERTLNATQAAASLGVSHILEGSVRRAEGRVRVTARLVEGTTGRQLWANRYDRLLEDVFALQDELSRSVVGVLELQLVESDERSVRHQGTDNFAAYELFLKGRSFYLRGLAAHSLRVASAFFRRAIEFDPGFARAHAQLAMCESHLSMSLANGSAEISFDACLQHSLRALELDPMLADAHAGKGLALYGAGEYEEAGSELDVAIRLDPELFEAQFFQARNHRLQGDRSRAAELFERAAALRPNDFRALGLLGEELQALGQADSAQERYRQCLMCLEAEIGAHPDNAGALAFGSAVLTDLERFEQAADWANWALIMAPDDCLVHYNVARALLMLGRPEDALRHLKTAFQTPPVVRRRLALWMRFDQDFEPLSNEAGFQALLHEALGG